ncbi:MAG: TIGR04348 family glycosyltransferase [Zoogloeaceae bacterium]|jgi:putative glycosyltransferase (TIGR04348 family)|nr:TIGR04348 family glycosyltransferase [Zoogloeaceae bacterium]
MSAAKVIIVTPAPPGSRAGNRNTAARWARILRGLGCRVRVMTEWNGEDGDLLVALHARKSQAALRGFRARHPERPALLALTGTDLYRDIAHDHSAAASLDIASGLIVLQEAALAELTPRQRRKAHVIHQSVATALTPAPPARLFRACVLGHLREEKDPFRAARALRLLPDRHVEIVQAGQALSKEMAREARRRMREDGRYRWLGELPHWTALRLLARSHVMVISSWLEGGAHVVSEAIAIGVPVIASDIPGNRGLLGAGYPACYPAGDHVRLAALLRQAIDERRFLARLTAAVKQRRPLIDPLRERRAWQTLLRETLG